jgi:hypothetical protein
LGLSEDDLKTVTALRKLELDIVDRSLESQRKKVYAQAQPKPHQFELARGQ